jgi:hypothetical protein
VLLAVELRYSSPSYLGDVLDIRATVARKVDSQHVLSLTLRIQNLTRGTRAASGRALVGVVSA